MIFYRFRCFQLHPNFTFHEILQLFDPGRLNNCFFTLIHFYFSFHVFQVIVVVAIENIPEINLKNAAELTVLGQIKIRVTFTRLSWERTCFSASSTVS